MKLYHVTFDLDEPETKVFYPRIPNSAGVGENKSIPRICLAPTIEQCIQALPVKSRDLRKGAKLRIYEANINEYDLNLIYPNFLFSKGYVPDALETEEYWYKKELEMTSVIKEIASFNYEFELAFSCIKISQIIDCVKELIVGKPKEEILAINKILDSDFLKSEDMYAEIVSYLDKIKDYDLYDDIWEGLATIPWAQMTKIYDVKFVS